MTKVEAIAQVMHDNGGAANWNIIYDNIEKYYPTAKQSETWKAGLRGVLYREIRKEKRFKKIGLGIFALREYVEEEKPDQSDEIRMHSYIEGICLELGNFKKHKTFTADPSASFKDNIKLHDLTTQKECPYFTYNKIIKVVKRIDVIWFNKLGFLFPQRIFEVVDSVGTLTGAFNRSLHLLNFKTEFFIVAPEKHRTKFKNKVNSRPYLSNKSRFRFINYDDLIDLYENTERVNRIESNIFDN